MWNSPRNPCLKLTPRQVAGLIHRVFGMSRHAGDIPDIRRVHLIADEPCYGKVDPMVVVWESHSLIEQLTTNAPVPPRGHEALAECVLAKLVADIFIGGIREEAASEEAGKTGDAPSLDRDQINLLRLVAEQEPLKHFRKAGVAGINPTLEKLFFGESHLRLGINEPASLPTNSEHGIRNSTEVSATKFVPSLRGPTKAEWRESHRRFALIMEWASKSDQHMPVGYLDSGA